MAELDPKVRTGLTLAALLLLLGLGAVWGWSAATKPVPSTAPVDTGPCRSLTVSAGDLVRPEDVVVSVFNAGNRAGLAERTLGLFVDAGFGRGESKNAPRNSGVTNAEIWTTTPEHPAVRLVASRLTGVDIIEGPTLGPGVVVLVGDQFQELAAGEPTVVAEDDAEICAPVPEPSPIP